MNFEQGRTIETLKPRRMPEKFKPFPVECLPQPIWTYVVEGAKTLVCDPAFIALPMLSALAGAIGNSRRIKLKAAWSEPAIIWSAIVGESGSMKSPAIDLAMRPMIKIQKEAFREHAEKMEEFEKKLEEYENALRQRKKALEMPDKPVEPIAKRYYCSDVTVEALAGLLANAPRGLLLARDELSGWVNSFNSYKGGKGGDDAKWLELYRAGTLLVDRKGGSPKTIHIPNASVSVLGGIQPGILAQVLGTEHFENGLAARLLLAMPPRKAKQWTEADIDSGLASKAEDIFRSLMAMQMEADFYGDFKAKILPMTPAAQKAWIAFYNEHAEEQAAIEGGEMAAAMSKLEAYAARLALVIHCVRVAAGDPKLASEDYIDDNSVIPGVLLTNWFKDEVRRVYAAISEEETHTRQRQLFELVQRKGGSITVRDLRRASRSYQGSGVAKNALQELVDIGWGIWEHPQADANGGRPSEVFILNSVAKTPF